MSSYNMEFGDNVKNGALASLTVLTLGGVGYYLYRKFGKDAK